MHPLHILVTGASGFVGGYLLEKLLAEGHKVVAMHNRPLDEETKLRFSGYSQNAVTWIRADITSDDLSKLCDNIDVVFHLAAYSTVEESADEIKKLHEVNIVGTRRLAEACKQAGVKHFILVSSVAACESSPEKVIDEMNGYPKSAYGKSKLEAENIVLGMAGNGFEVTVLRPTALFGEYHLGSVFELVKTIKNRRFVIFGSGENRTNFYYIRDFVEVLVLVKNNKKAYGEVFIACDSPCSLYKLTSFIAGVLEMKAIISRLPIFIGWWMGAVLDVVAAITKRNLPLSRRRVAAMTRDIVYSNNKLAQTLQIEPGYGVLRGVQASVAWYQSQKLL